MLLFLPPCAFALSLLDYTFRRYPLTFPPCIGVYAAAAARSLVPAACASKQWHAPAFSPSVVAQKSQYGGAPRPFRRALQRQ